MFLWQHCDGASHAAVERGGGGGGGGGDIVWTSIAISRNTRVSKGWLVVG
jgi:hypothetical protein